MLRASLQALTGLSVAALLASPASAQFDVVDSGSLPHAMALVDALDVGAFTLQSLQLPEDPGSHVELDVVIDGVTQTLALQRWSIRSAEHFQVLAQGEDGQYTEVDVGPSNLWRGLVVGAPESRISADLSNGQIDALVRLTDDGPVWAIQPLSDVDDTASIVDHVVYSSEDSLDLGKNCGGALIDLGGAAPDPTPAGGGFQGLADDVVCEIACDADVEFYQKNGSSVTNTENDIELIIDRVQNIYQPQVSIQYEITTIIVRTAEPDPYGSTSAGTLLNQFQNHWNSNQGGIQRDVAHLFTGKNIQGGTIGVAYLSVICSIGSAYGLSESRFTNNLTSRTALTAHELGHNWAAQHCDGQGDCWIMCSGLGGCAGNLTNFGNSSKNSINNKKNAVNCLSPAVPPPPPVLTGLSQSTISPLGGQVTVTGTGLTGATSASVGGQPASIVPLSDTSVIVTVPNATTLGSVALNVINSSGASNNLTLTYVVAQPPIAIAPNLIITVSQTSATWTVATDPADTVYFLVDADPGTFTYKGFSVLATALPVLSISTNSAGVGNLVAPIDPSLGGVGAYTIYTQFAFFRPSIYAASNVLSTTVF